MAPAWLWMVLSGPVLAGSNYPFAIVSERTPEGHRVVAHNNGPAPVSLRLSLSDSRNIRPDRALPYYGVVPANASQDVLLVQPADPGQGYHFNLQSTWALGDYTARPDEAVLYRLPFKDGSRFRLGQSPGGPVTTHDTAESRFAVDIPMPEGTPVLAAREGVVIETEAGQTTGGQRSDLKDRANFVRILHADGSLASYAHLAPGGVQVAVGQRVSAGAPIGLSGNTGYSSGPHLHFAVLRQAMGGDGFAMQSLPFRFYVGNPPAPFAPQFGLLVEADYRHARSAPTVEPAVAAAVRQWRPEEGPLMLPEAPVSGWRHSLKTWSPWRWAMALGGLWLLLWLLARVRGASRPRGRPPAKTIPREVPGAILDGLAPRDKLVIACGGDRSQADRLIQFEQQWQAGISEGEAADRALARLKRSRAGTP